MVMVVMRRTVVVVVIMTMRGGGAMTASRGMGRALFALLTSLTSAAAVTVV